MREKGFDRTSAIEVGETLRLDGYIVHVADKDKRFIDGHFLYQFCEPRRLSDVSLTSK